MLTMFRKYCKDMTIGGAVGASIGATAGAAAGRVGLNQVCITGMFSSQGCSMITMPFAHSAVNYGALTGAAVGFGMGLILYPMYKAAVSCLNGQDDQNVSQVEIARSGYINQA